MAVDSANTPITAMVRHYDRLLTFKTDGAFSTAYSTLDLADGATAAAFYTQAIENFIRKNPEQWFWVHNRWKTKHKEA